MIREFKKETLGDLYDSEGLKNTEYCDFLDIH